MSGTNSPYRETSNIYDGSQFTTDIAVQNVVGDPFRGATWVSPHQWRRSGLGLVLDGSEDCEKRLKLMLYWDVNHGITRRSWARNEGAMATIKQEMEKTSAPSDLS